jgi:hypothetical protein
MAGSLLQDHFGPILGHGEFRKISTQGWVGFYTFGLGKFVEGATGAQQELIHHKQFTTSSQLGFRFPGSRCYSPHNPILPRQDGEYPVSFTEGHTLQVNASGFVGLTHTD